MSNGVRGRTEVKSIGRVPQKVDLPASGYLELAKLRRNPNTYYFGGSSTTD
jgi:hypothetical protein